MSVMSMLGRDAHTGSNETSALLPTPGDHRRHNVKTSPTGSVYDDASPQSPPLSSTTGTTGQATSWQTIANLMKTCMGTGCLALAYACQQSGVVLYCVGLVAIAAWNFVCISRLLQCLTYIPTAPQLSRCTDEGYELTERNEAVTEGSREPQATHRHFSRPPPPPGTSTFGRVAWYAFGSMGLQVLDVLVVLLFLGIIIAYVAAVITFISGTPLGTVYDSTGRSWNALLAGLIMGTMSLVTDVGYLSGASAVGLIVLLSAFVVIAWYGIVARMEAAADYATSPMELWPNSLSGVSRWFGIVVFGYGVVPLTYNFQKSMKEPDHIVGASTSALIGVAGLYIVLGVGLYALFPNLTADVLHELPTTGLLPVVTRVALSCTILTTAPLLIVPCAEVIEGKFGITSVMTYYRSLIRFGVVSVCVVVAVVLPNFVQVLSFVGCFCVALVSFCLPPMLHLRLAYLAHTEKNVALRRPLTISNVVADMSLASWGVVVTMVSTLCILNN